jgi:hypothetical protein
MYLYIIIRKEGKKESGKDGGKVERWERRKVGK